MLERVEYGVSRNRDVRHDYGKVNTGITRLDYDRARTITGSRRRLSHLS